MDANAAQAWVQVRHLCKRYGTTHALDDVSFQFTGGEIVGFLGPNGAGKSTTLKILAGYLRPTSGDAQVLDISVVQQPKQAQRYIGYLPEHAPLYDDMMVVDFLHYAATLHDVPRQIWKERLPAVVRDCGIETVLSKDIAQLSKGYRQRVGLAQALLHDPSILLLDEPTSGLDPNQIVEFRALLRRLANRGKAIFLSTHMLSEAQACCDRIIIIDQGRLVADDPTNQAGATQSRLHTTYLELEGPVTADQRNALTTALGTLPGIEAVRWDRVQTSPQHAARCTLLSSPGIDARAGIFRICVEQEHVILELHRKNASLEETFRQLTAA